MKKVIRVLMSMLVLATGLTIALTQTTEKRADAANPNKITICHRTAAVNNPYRRITVNFNSIATDITKPANNGPSASGHG